MCFGHILSPSKTLSISPLSPTSVHIFPFLKINNSIWAPHSPLVCRHVLLWFSVLASIYYKGSFFDEGVIAILISIKNIWILLGVVLV